MHFSVRHQLKKSIGRPLFTAPFIVRSPSSRDKRLFVEGLCRRILARPYSSHDILPPWSEEDFKYFGTYEGKPTPIGLQKKMTGLTGLPVQPAGREILMALYDKIFVELAKFPPEYAYRIEQEQLVRERTKILYEEEDIIRIEEEIDQGQIEELIIEAEDELQNVIPMLLTERPWEVPEHEKVKPMAFSKID